MLLKRRLLLPFWLLLILPGCTSSVRESDRVVVRVAADPESLNPVNFSNATAQQIINLLYQSLLTVDLADNSIKPLLVASLPQVTKTDSLSFFTFQIREEASWDTGIPITAHDVDFSLKIIKCPLLNNEYIRPRFEFIQAINIDPDNQRNFTLICKGYTPEMELMTGDFFILPSYLLDPDSLLSSYSIQEFSGNKDWLEKQSKLNDYASYFNSDRFTRNKAYLRGSGGYEIEDWKTGQFVALKKKEDWWGNRSNDTIPYLTAEPNRIVFQVIPENNTALLALQNGQIDVFEGIPATDFTRLSSDRDFKNQFNLFTPDTYDCAFLGINSRIDKFADRKTRQALSYLLDLDNIIKATQADFATKTIGPISPNNSDFYHAGLRTVGLNPETAEDLLRQAGWVRQNSGWQKKHNGQLLSLSLFINYRAGNTVFENTALIFQQAAAAVGIPVILQPLEGMHLSQKLKEHDFEFFIGSLRGNPFVFDFKPFLHTDNALVNGQNFTGFGTPESDSLIEIMNQTQDEKQKAIQIMRLQEILQEESTLIFLYFTKNRIAIRKRFSNVKISGIKPGYDLSAFSTNP
jgi:peptide/nickel transport system substrate-binding protein